MKKFRNPLPGTFVVSLLACLVALSGCSSSDSTNQPAVQTYAFNLAITNGRVMDPISGTDEISTVAIANGKIAVVAPEGAKNGEDLVGQAERVIDAGGLVVSPGFINTHTHEGDILESMKVYVKDGITTWIGGNCGSSPGCLSSTVGDCAGYPIGGYFQALEEEGIYNNFAGLTGLNSLRSLVGLDYTTGASEQQRAQMVDMLASDLAQGSLGVSFGSYYHPGCTYEEMLDTAMESAAHGGMAASHLRDNTFYICADIFLNEQVIDEGIETARQAGLPYLVSHITDITYGLPSTQLMIDKISKAIYEEHLPMAADVIGSNSFPNDFFTIARYGTIPLWLLMAVAGVEPTDFQVTEDVYIDGVLFLEAYDSPQTVDQVQYLMDAILEDRAESPGILAHIVRPANTMLALAQPFVFVGNDGYVTKDRVTGELSGHPRAAGSMARFLGHWTRDHQVLGLMQALYKLTAAPALFFGLADKGRLQEGYDADLVIFDPDTIIDTAVCEPGNSDPATFLNPPAGISYVIVNGEVAVEDGELTGVKSGQVIRRTWEVPGTTPEPPDA